MDVMDDSKPQHVVLFPFVAHGHINPFLALAELLGHRHPTLTVTLVNTPLNIQNISSSFPPSFLRLRSLPFSPAVHGLHPDAENFATVPHHQKVTLGLASESLLRAFEQLIVDIIQEDGYPLLCIIADAFFAWTVNVARRFGVFHSIFITGGAYGTAIFFSLCAHLPHRQTNSDDFPLPEFPEIIAHRSQLSEKLLAADGNDPLLLFLQRQFSLCSESDAIIVNTVEEVETTGLRMLRKLLPVPIWPIGPLLISSPSTAIVSKDHTMEWLDSQPPASVLYISFGSQNSITAPQMMELAMGLEASETRFIWVIRPPVGFDDKGDVKAEWLPEKFEERMRERGTGILVHGWAPQLEILSHASTGAFLSHCGWNSVLESLSRGVPIIAWPLNADQPHNARMLEELGVCMQVVRGNTKSSKVDRSDVERVVREVMCGGERAKEMRRGMQEVWKLMKAAWREGFGSSVRGLAEFFFQAASPSSMRYTDARVEKHVA